MYQDADQIIDRTNITLILVDTFTRLQQYYGQRDGLAPEAEMAWERIADIAADVLHVDASMARVMLQQESDERANNRIGIRGTIWRMAGGSRV